MTKQLIFGLMLVLIGMFGVNHSHAQSNVEWSANFYNNTDLQGQTVHFAQYRGLTLDWGNGSPAASVNTDFFSARFNTSTFFEGGTYRFSILADDGFRLLIDDVNVVLDEWAGNRTGQEVTVDVPLTRGNHKVQVDFRENTGQAYVIVNWFNVANPGLPPPPPDIDPIESTTDITPGTWIAQYFNNTGLTGFPVSTLSETTPNHSWGNGAPMRGVGPDNFSARWTNTRTLPAGTYRIVANGDDGVRVYVDGIARINQFGNATGIDYTYEQDLSAGTHTFVVEFVEYNGDASISFQLLRVDATTTQPPPEQGPIDTGATGTVTASRLNVRNAPSALTGAIIDKINLNESYPVLGRNADTTWWLIRLNTGATGWVSGRYFAAINTAAVPVVSDTTIIDPPQAQPGTATTRFRVNLRRGPSTTYDRLTVVPNRVVVRLVARNAASTWYKVDYGGDIGWILGNLVNVAPGTSIPNLPVQVI